MARSRDLLGDNPAQWTTPAGYPGSLALCVVDAIQSIGVNYSSVQQVVARYREARRVVGADSERDGAVELLETFTTAGGAAGWAEQIGTWHLTSSRSGVLKAVVIERAAQLLLKHDVANTATLRAAAASERGESLKREWLALRGQRSGLTWNYVLMNSGAQSVKPDRMIRGYLARVAGGGQPSVGEAHYLVSELARRFEVSERVLDHRIWSYERGERRRAPRQRSV